MPLFFISIFINWHSVLRRAFPFLAVYPFIYLFVSAWTCRISPYSMGCNSFLSLNILWFTLFVWPVEALAGRFLCSCDKSASFFWALHYFFGRRCSKILLYFAWPGAVWDQPFLLETLITFSGKWFLEAKICVLTVLSATGCHCSSAISAERAEMYVCATHI